MRVKVWIFCWVVFLFTACSKTVEKPENLISEDKMVDILYDTYLYQQSAYLSEINKPELNFAYVDALILQKHEVSAEDFKASYQYYVLVPDQYKKILRKIRDRMEEQLPEEERKQRIQNRENAGKNMN